LAVPKEIHEHETGRVLPFPSRAVLDGKARHKAAANADDHHAEIADLHLRKYERSAEPDDYGRRMVINVIAFAFIIMLTLAGIWIADQLALLRKHQDCALSGRRNCTELDLRR
jgi:hypothetical protein